MGVSVPDADWLAQVTEPALEPELPIVDPHHHLWFRPGDQYLVPELSDDLASGHNVVATVFAECGSMYRPDGPLELRSLGETEFVAGCAAMGASGAFGSTKICQGMFGRVDLALADAVGPIFEQHLDCSGGRFKGVRYTTAWDPSDKVASPAAGPELLLDAAVQSAAAVMSRFQLTLDCWVYHHQLQEVVQLAEALPDLHIVVEHTGVPILGGPYRDRQNEVHDVWLAGIHRLAGCDNVFLKLGAFPIRRSGDGVNRSLPPTSGEVAAAWGPWMTEAIAALGPARCMFESNFPVQKLWSSYQVTWNAFKRLAADFSEHDKRELFHDAACRAYRL